MGPNYDTKQDEVTALGARTIPRCELSSRLMCIATWVMSHDLLLHVLQPSSHSTPRLIMCLP